MRRIAFLLIAVAICAVSAFVYADYSVTHEGTWPKGWPAELETLRKQSRTLVGPQVLYRHHAIPFASREEFELVWPHLLKVKTGGAPIVLVGAPGFFLGKEHTAGVVVHCPPSEAGNSSAAPVAPIQNLRDAKATTYLELIVDGQIVDLNRIALPADTLIIDQRFEHTQSE
jgi:hypothetical protein